jgi:hypothetical protein
MDHSPEDYSGASCNLPDYAMQDEMLDAMLAAARDELNALTLVVDDPMRDTELLPTEYASEYGAYSAPQVASEKKTGRYLKDGMLIPLDNQKPARPRHALLEAILGSECDSSSNGALTPDEKIEIYEPRPDHNVNDIASDMGFRSTIYRLSVRTGNNNITHEAPAETDTGLPKRYRQMPESTDDAPVPLVLNEHSLDPETQLNIEMNDNALVYLGPGEQGAVVTYGVAACSTAAGVALFADGTRAGYVSHYAPETDDEYRAVGMEGEQPLTARIMQQFTETTVARGGLERVIIAAAHFKGLELYHTGHLHDDGIYDTEGSRVVDAIDQTAEQLREAYGADVTIIPYHLAYKGAHSMGVYMSADRNIIYFDNEPVAEL